MSRKKVCSGNPGERDEEATGIFVEVGGKYYLDEARLQQVEQQRGTGDATGGQWASRKNMFALRMVRRVVGVSAIILVVLNIFVFGNLTSDP